VYLLYSGITPGIFSPQANSLVDNCREDITLHPVLFKIGSFTVYAWGAMLSLAVLLALWGISRIARREGYDSSMVLDLVILSVLGGLIGARLAYVLGYDWPGFVANPLIVFSIGPGGIEGMIWYGSFIGGIIPFGLYIWKKNLSFWKVADMFSPYLALGYAVVRVGCFLRGCCYGNITSGPWGVVFPYIDSFSRYPTQLFSSALNLLLFVFLLWLYKRRSFSGQIFISYLLGYGIYRFIIEFFRYSAIYIGPFTLAQVYTLGLLAVGLGLYYWRQRQYANAFYVPRSRRS